MIQDISLNKIQVRDLEESLIDDYFKDEDAQKGLSSSLDYYQVLFEQKLEIILIIYVRMKMKRFKIRS